MNKIIYNSTQIEMLERNPNVNKVFDRSITYNPNFKVKAVQENVEGKDPQEIFLEHGFDLSVIGINKPKECLKLWRRIYKVHGEEGLLTERRGIKSAGQPSKEALTAEERLKRAEARIAYFEAGDKEELRPNEKSELIERINSSV